MRYISCSSICRAVFPIISRDIIIALPRATVENFGLFVDPVGTVQRLSRDYLEIISRIEIIINLELLGDQCRLKSFNVGNVI